MKQLKVLELFAGTRSVGKEFEKRGHLVYSIELDRQHDDIDWYGDVNIITPQEIIQRMGGIPDVVWSSPPCFTEETLVLTDYGFKKIKDINVGDKVITHTNAYKEVLNIGRKLTNETKSIKISTSDIINTTNNHPFYARTKKRVWNNEKRGWDKRYGEPQWIKAKNLNKNNHMVGFAINTESKIPSWSGTDKVIKNQVNSYTYNENKISGYFENENFWWVIGRYLGDGWTRHTDDRHEFYICCAKDELNEITEVLDKLGKDFFNYNISEQRTTYKISIYKKELVEYVSQFGKYAHGKRLTGDIINLPKYLLKSFLDGYFSADGYKKINDFGKVSFTVSSVSKELIHGVGQCIAKVYNIPFSITKFCKNSYDTIEGRKVKVRDIYMLKYNINNKKCYSFIEDGILWTNIKSIKDNDGEKFVYNMEVKDDNSYTANGIIVHNCEKFSVAAIGKHWIKGTNLPKTEDTQKALDLLERTVKLIKDLNPKYFFIENPRGKMRKMDCVQEFDRHTVTYCKYGDTRMKPTDLWTNHPNPKFKPPCKNGDPCHVPAPRGSRTGTQGIKTYKDRSRIPEQLCNHISIICEEGFNNLIDVNYIIDNIVNEAIHSTTEGNYIFSKEYIENKFSIELNERLIKMISEELNIKDEVADVQFNDSEIDVIIWGEYIN